MKILLTLCTLLSLGMAQQKSVKAVFTNASPEIDGIQEPLWNSAVTHTGFTQLDPIPNNPATKKTEFQFMYDNENVYFYIKAYDNPDEIVTESAKRDNAFNGDWVIIIIDPMDNKNNAYEFFINPSNVQGDSKFQNGGNEDWSWDAIWYSNTQITDDGWVAELKIPLRALKFQSKDIQAWGFNIIRKMRKSEERVFWQAIDPEYGYQISRFAKIDDLKGLKTKNEVLIIPSAVSAFDSSQDYDPTKTGRNFGFDLRYNFDEQHSVLATFKPDFAQIEADADQVNLSDYPIFLQEKRPFFLEGRELYSFNDEVFYSRRMSKPDAGFKFQGDNGNLKYGVTYVRNEMSSRTKERVETFDTNTNQTTIDTTKFTHEHDENFIFARALYEKANAFSFGYLAGIVDSKYELSGVGHTVDMSFYPLENLRIYGLASTTVLNNTPKENVLTNYLYFGSERENLEHRGNSSIRLQMNYNSETWYSYFRLQKKTNYYEQGLFGMPETNNGTEQNFNLGRLFRLENSFWRQVRANININSNGTYDNSVQGFNYNVNAHANHQFNSIGFVGYGAGYNINRGEFRSYKRVEQEMEYTYENDVLIDSTRVDVVKYYTPEETRHFDTYGYFKGGDNNYQSFWAYIESDFSKPIAGSINVWNGENRGAKESGFSTTLQLRPNNDLKLRFDMNYTDVGKSDYHLFQGIYKSFSLRTDYALLPNLHMKALMQYNPQYDRLSSNLVLTYEYIRGSFIYFSYAETGLIDETYNEGMLYKNYDLDSRTISLKWTYSLFL